MKKMLIALLAMSTPALAQQGQPPDLNQMFFKQFDRDGNGRVDRAEFLQPTEAQFDHMDKNKDGTLEPGEVQAFNDEMEQRMQQMRRQMQQQGMPRR